jgi:hypothetical protein
MMAGRNRKMQLEVQVGSSAQHGPARVVKVDGGGEMFAPLVATFTDGELEARLVIDVVGGAPCCVEYTVRRTDGKGLEQFTSEVAAGLNIRSLVKHAVVVVAVEAKGHGVEPAESYEAVAAVLSSAGRRRTAVTDERLQEFADAYRERWVKGGQAEFAAHLNISERQMWRLKRLATDRGFMEAR